jgi:guanine deaminase
MGAAELIHNGVTTVQDMLTFFPFSEEHLDAVMQAYADIGIRVVFAIRVGDRTGLDAVPYWKEVVPEKYHSYLASFVAPFEGATPLEVVTEQYRRLRDYNDRITWALAPSIPQLCSTELLQGMGELSEAEGLQIFTHNCDGKSFTLADRTRYADHDGSSVKYLHDIGLLGPRMGLVHSIWVRQDEIDLMAETGAHVNLIPAGNLKTKSGVPPIRGYLEAGVSIGLGTDNSSNGDAQNMFHVMKFFAGLAAVCDPDPGPPSAEDTLRISTLGGAEVLGLKGQVGDLQPGMRADITILDLSNLNFVPLNSAARQLVFTESGQSVETVIVDGRVVMRDRKLVSIDEGELRDAVEVVMPDLTKDRDAVSDRIAEIYPYLLEAWRKTQAHDLGMQRYIGDGSG